MEMRSVIWDAGYILFFDLGDSYMDMLILCTLMIYALYFMDF